MPAVDISDDPWLIAHHAGELIQKLPAYMNIRTCRHLWHAGTGNDGLPEWNRFELFKGELRRLGWGSDVEQIESEAQKTVEKLWQEQLQKR